MRRVRWRHLGLLLPVLALLAWLSTALSPDGLRALWTVLTTQRALLLHTLTYAVAVAVIATALSWAIAHVLHSYRVPGGRLLSLLCLAPLLVPSFTFAMGLLILLGHNGLATRMIPGVEVYGAGGLIVAGTLSRLPYAYLPLAWAYRRLDPHLAEAATALGASPRAVFARSALPRLVPVAASTALIVLADSITDLANPLVIGGGFSTLAQRLYEAVNGEGDTAAAAVYALLLTAPAVVLGIAASRLAEGRASRPVPLAAAAVRRPGPLAWLLICVAWTVGGVVAVLLVVVAAGSVASTVGPQATPTLHHFADLLVGPAARPLGTTLLVALVTVPIVVALAFWIATSAASAGRLEPTRRLLTASAALPPAALGVAGLFAHTAAAGALGASELPVRVVTWSAFVVIVAVHTLRFVPAVGLPALRTIRGLVPATRDSAISAGARPRDLALAVYWPRLRPELLSGALTTWARTLTAVSSVILLTNSQVPLLTVRMLADIDAGRLAPACAATVVLALLVGLAGAAQRLVQRAGERDRNRDAMEVPTR